MKNTETQRTQSCTRKKQGGNIESASSLCFSVISVPLWRNFTVPCDLREVSEMSAERILLFKLSVCCLLIIAFLGCAGPRIVMKPEEARVFIDDARASIDLAQEAGAYRVAPEQIARAESLLARAEEASKDEKRGAESIRLASEARAKAEAAHAISRQTRIHEEEMQRISSEKEAEMAALQAAQKVALEAKREKDQELQACAQRLEQIKREKEGELAAVKADLDAAEDRAERKERELAAATSDYESTKGELEEALEEIRAYSEKSARVEEEMAAELAATRAALRDAESKSQKAEVKARTYSERVASLERERQKEIAVSVAKEQATQKRVARAEVKKKTLQGEPSLEALEKVRKAIEGWRVAWEREDPDRYVSYYADDAEIRKVLIAGGKEQVEKLSKAEMREEMARTFARDIQFKMEGPRLEAGSHAVRATFEFFKQVPADVYEGEITKHEKWIKELLFREVREAWKIVKEDWNIYHDIPEYAELR